MYFSGKRSTLFTGFLTSAIFLSLLGGCGNWELRDKSKDKSDPWPDATSIPVQPIPFPPPTPGASQDCKAWTGWINSASSGNSMQAIGGYQCTTSGDYSWRTSCKSGACRSIKVFAHYMLEKNLGDSRTVQIEAFDNKFFQGAPAASVEISSFVAKSGEWKEADLIVEPGEYYVRAYIGSIDEVRVPYVMGGMDLVGDQPFGFYGAMSQPQKISVAPEWQNPAVNPVHVMLDKLVAKPGSEAPTNARIRFSLTVADLTKIQAGRKVIVAFLDEADPQAMPVQKFDLLTDNFFIAGREGKADLVTPALEVESYYVFAFVDLNSNGLVDELEPQVLLQEDGQAKKIRLKEKYTQTIALTL